MHDNGYNKIGLHYILNFPPFTFVSRLLLNFDTLHEVRGVEVVLEPDEVLLDAARGHEAVEDRDGARLVVRAAAPRTAERLLPDDGARALFVVVDVPGRVAQSVRRLHECVAVRGKTACDMIRYG